MIYRRRNIALDFGDLDVDRKRRTLAEDNSDEVSSFRRVDLLPSPKLKEIDSASSVPYSARGGASSLEHVWYCERCGDGPIPDWNPICVGCDSKRA